MENKEYTGRVCLVGAGCSAGLMTLEGLARLQEAQVVLYDALLDPAILGAIPAGAEAIPVGKRCGRHSLKQAEINALLVEKAREGKRVVRLKGGDSFVLGRGGEELQALQEAGIPCDVVPGVTSAVAVPEHLGIPVTHRGLSRSFTVVTGHTQNGDLEDWQALAELQGTLVFLMGLGQLPHICRQLQQHGKAPETPVSVLCGGYSARELRLDGTLATIEGIARNRAFAPAIILVGPVAALHLEGQKRPGVAVTGSRSFCGQVARALEPAGRSVTQVPVLEVEPLLDQLPPSILGFPWLVFTSRNGVRLFGKWLQQHSIDHRKLAGSWFAAIGEGTADELARLGFAADLVPETYTAEALGQALVKALAPGERCLLLRAEEGSPDLPRVLEEAGVAYEELPLYRIRPIPPATGGKQELAPGLMIFGSAKGVHTFLAQYTLAPGTWVLCIGPITARAARQEGIAEPACATVHSVAGLVQALQEVQEP